MFEFPNFSEHKLLAVGQNEERSVLTDGVEILEIVWSKSAESAILIHINNL
jgi:hypothetical protein